MTRAIMIQGTGSHVGKSVVVAGLARALLRRGLKVAPFKPQNMSNNAAVTAEGGEIGRAQALQARACRVEPSVHMNPVLLKPQSEIGSQIVVQGQVMGSAKARELIADPKLKLLVLDELNIALRYDYLPLAEVVATLRARRPGLHIVVTGRNAKPEMLDAADLVTEMSLVKHHFAAGVKAQEGIEF